MNNRPALEHAKDRYDDIKNPPEDNPHKSLNSVRPVVPEETENFATMGITGKKYKITNNGEYIKIE